MDGGAVQEGLAGRPSSSTLSERASDLLKDEPGSRPPPLLMVLPSKSVPHRMAAEKSRLRLHQN